MKQNMRVYMNIFWIILGAILIGLSFAGKVDEFWNGMGTALLIIGAIRLLRYHRLNKNDAYRERKELEMSDERNQFIRNKAWAWAGYYFVLIVAIGSIILRFLGLDDLSTAAACAVWLLMILYWISYLILKRKY